MFLIFNFTTNLLYHSIEFRYTQVWGLSHYNPPSKKYSYCRFRTMTDVVFFLNSKYSKYFCNHQSVYLVCT